MSPIIPNSWSFTMKENDQDFLVVKLLLFFYIKYNLLQSKISLNESWNSSPCTYAWSRFRFKVKSLFIHKLKGKKKLLFEKQKYSPKFLKLFTIFLKPIMKGIYIVIDRISSLLTTWKLFDDLCSNKEKPIYTLKKLKRMEKSWHQQE